MQLRDLRIHTAKGRKILSHFLSLQGLFFEDDSELACEHAHAVGLYDAQDCLVGTGACFGPILKYFSLAPHIRGQNLLPLLLTHCIKWQYNRQITHLFVYTTPENGLFFEKNGFYKLCATEDVVLYENRQDGPALFAQRHLQAHDAGQAAGAVVLNANPFTKGHEYLIRHAASQCALVHVFVVEENASDIPFATRLALVQAGTAHMKHVRVHASGAYIISAASFPSYFLKDRAPRESLQQALDVQLFAQHVAPHFSIHTRFVGEEPLCAVTQQYNATMLATLPQHGIQVVQIPRCTEGQACISASRVRALWRQYALHCQGKHEEGYTMEALNGLLQALVPVSTWQFIQENPESIFMQKAKI